MASFARGDQEFRSPAYTQAISTKVANQTLGLAYLAAIPESPWAIGAGLYLIHWEVTSDDRVERPQGGLAGHGISHWTRQGLGLLASYHWSGHLETQFQFIASHYGYQNQPTRAANLNMFWHF